jgi:hypothetical protein
METHWTCADTIEDAAPLCSIDFFAG